MPQRCRPYGAGDFYLLGSYKYVAPPELALSEPRLQRALCNSQQRFLSMVRFVMATYSPRNITLASMSNTYTQIYIHVVFAVEGRQNLIRPEHNDELQKYITGIVSGQKQKLIAINNMPDHLWLAALAELEIHLDQTVVP
jgi:Transposase IS200 like